MAAIDFPTATSNGQTFEADSGVIYTYVGTPPNGFWSGTFGTTGLTTLDGRYIAKNDSNTIQTIQTQGLKFNSGNADTILIDGLNSRIGIGTTSPTRNLTVSNGTNPIIAVQNSGQSTEGVFNAPSGGTINLGTVSTADLTLSTNSLEHVRINSSGRIGIGESAPQAKLHVKEGNSGVTPDSNRDTLFLEAAGNAGLTIGTPNANSGYVAFGDPEDENAGQIIYRHSNNSMSLFTAGSERASIDSSGRLLVGTSSDFTNGTGTKLQSVDPAGGQIAIGRDTSSMAVGNLVGRIRWYGNVGGTPEETARIAVEADDTHALGDKPGRLVFSTTADGASSPTARMTINSSGATYITGDSATSQPGYLSLQGGGAAVNSGTQFCKIAFLTQDVNVAGADKECARIGVIAENDHGGNSDAKAGIAFFTRRDELDDPNERMRINNLGNLGIGTTSPSELLHISALGATDEPTLKISSENSNIFLRTAGSSGLFPTGGAANDGELIYIGGDFRVGNGTANGNLIFFNGSGYPERMRIDSSGRLLVGTSTARANFYSSTNAPAGQFEGTGNDGSALALIQNFNANTLGGQLILAKSNGSSIGSNTLVASGNACGRVTFQGNDGTQFVEAAQIRCDVDGTPGASDMPGRLVFSTTADGSDSPAERMRINRRGEFTLSGGVSNYQFFILKVTNGGAQNLLRLRADGVFDTGNASKSPYNLTTATAANVVVESSGYLKRSTSSIRYKTDVETLQSQYADAILNCRPVWYRSLAELDNKDWGYWGFIAEEVAEIDPRLVFWKTHETTKDENGNDIEVELNEPVAESVQYDRFVPHLLNLIQRQQQVIETISNENPINIRQTTSLLNNPFITFLNSNGDTAGSIIQNGVNSVTYATSSDYRLKDNVVELTAAIPRLKQLAPKRFNFIAAADVTVDGFLAHEAQAVVPEAVTGSHNQVDGDGNPVMQGIDQSKLVPLLTAALQEAIGRIETLEAKVATLEGS